MSAGCVSRNKSYATKCGTPGQSVARLVADLDFRFTTGCINNEMMI